MKTLLFVDPNLKDKQMLHIMNQIFLHEGFTLVAAFDAKDAASKAASQKPDIILAKSADDTLEFLKANAKTAPVIVLLPTKSSASYAEKMKNAGAADAVTMDSASILQVLDKAKDLLA